MFSVQTDNSERNSSLAAFFSARSSLFILFYFFGFVSSVKFRIHNYFYSSVHTTEHQFLQWSEKQKGRGGMFFVTNQCANKIVVKMKGVLCEWCTDGPIYLTDYRIRSPSELLTRLRCWAFTRCVLSPTFLTRDQKFILLYLWLTKTVQCKAGTTSLDDRLQCVCLIRQHLYFFFFFF